jgi:hypothetical protein
LSSILVLAFGFSYLLAITSGHNILMWLFLYEDLLFFIVSSCWGRIVHSPHPCWYHFFPPPKCKSDELSR